MGIEKFMSDFDLEDPKRDRVRFSDTNRPAHAGSKKPGKVEMDGFMLGGKMIAQPILRMIKGKSPIDPPKQKKPGKVEIWGMEFDT